MIVTEEVTEKHFTQEMNDFGMAEGHAPVAHKVICVDFDKTIVEWGPLMGPTPLFKGASEAINRFKKAGYKIIILTSRSSQTWARSVVGADTTAVNTFLWEQFTYVAKILTDAGIPWDRITAEKVPAEWYIDDKAIEFTGNWDEVVSRILLTVR
jgi:hypothetical protein